MWYGTSHVLNVERERSSFCCSRNTNLQRSSGTGSLDSTKVHFKKWIILSLSNYVGDLECIVVKSFLRIIQPLPCKLPLYQCSRPQFYELQVRERLLTWFQNL